MHLPKLYFHTIAAFNVNQKLNSLKDLADDKVIPVGTMVDITDGKRLLLSNEEGGRVVMITMANT